MRILISTDGSKTALAAVRFVINKVAPSHQTTQKKGRAGGFEIHLLNVQPPLPSAVSTFIDSKAVRDYHKEEGEKALAPARKLLDAAGLRYESNVAIGDAAETIADYAAKIGCDEIVMSARGLGRIAGLLLGSTTTKVLSISKIPVTLVR